MKLEVLRSELPNWCWTSEQQPRGRWNNRCSWVYRGEHAYEAPVIVRPAVILCGPPATEFEDAETNPLIYWYVDQGDSTTHFSTWCAENREPLHDAWCTDSPMLCRPMRAFASCLSLFWQRSHRMIDTKFPSRVQLYHTTSETNSCPTLTHIKQAYSH